MEDIEKQKKIKIDGSTKRISRMKVFIILMALILVFLSISLNFVLLLKVFRIEKHFNQLYSNHTYLVMIDIDSQRMPKHF